MDWSSVEDADELAGELCELERVSDRIEFFRFRATAPVPGWARVALNGRMVLPEYSADGLFARVWEPVDWPALAAAHPDELVVGDPAAMWPIVSRT